MERFHSLTESDPAERRIRLDDEEWTKRSKSPTEDEENEDDEKGVDDEEEENPR